MQQENSRAETDIELKFDIIIAHQLVCQPLNPLSFLASAFNKPDTWTVRTCFPNETERASEAERQLLNHVLDNFSPPVNNFVSLELR